VLLVLANGFFVATEFSLVAVRRTRIQQLASEGNRRAESVLDRLRHLDSYIAATQLGITIASLALGWIGEPALAHLVEPALKAIPGISGESGDNLSHVVGFALAFTIITVLHIVFGELAPKSLALQRPEGTSLVVAGPIQLFYMAFRPIIYVLNNVGNGVVRLLGIEPAQGHELVQSAEELMMSIDASREAGLVDAAAHDIVERAFTFTDLTVHHVMVPRTELTAIPIDANLGQVLRLAAESGFSRLPVYQKNVDHIVGILSVKRLNSLLADMAETNVTPAFSVSEHMHPPLVVPETTPATDVLVRLRQAGAQLALIVDEYGGTAGMVSLEDLVGAIIGKTDENGLSMFSLTDELDGSRLLDGLMSLVELDDRHGVDLASDGVDVESLGGYVFARLGRVAVVGDEVISAKGHVLRVEQMDDLRIAQVRIRPADSTSLDAYS
jgi:CBS domain containing-hemolysin-like protein